MPLDVRPLTTEGAAACVALARSIGFFTDEAQWRMYLTVGEGLGAYEDGELAGAGMLNRFGAKLASIATMMVEPRRRRRGIARALFEQLLARAGDTPLFLYATEMGRPLYESAGFVTIDGSLRLEGLVSGVAIAPGDGARPMCAADLPRAVALDEEAQGAPRRALVESMLGAADRAWVVERGGAMVGFGMSSAHEGMRFVKPIVARDDDAARTLAARLTEGAKERVRFELQPGEEALVAWGRAAGLDVVLSTPLMTMRAAPLPGRRRLVRALAGRAYG